MTLRYTNDDSKQGPLFKIQMNTSKFAHGKHQQLSDNSSASEITKGVCCFFTNMSPQVLQLPLAKPFQWPLLFSICTGMEKFQKVIVSGFLCIRLHMCNLMAKEWLLSEAQILLGLALIVPNSRSLSCPTGLSPSFSWSRAFFGEFSRSLRRSLASFGFLFPSAVLFWAFASISSIVDQADAAGNEAYRRPRFWRSTSSACSTVRGPSSNSSHWYGKIWILFLLEQKKLRAQNRI